MISTKNIEWKNFGIIFSFSYVVFFLGLIDECLQNGFGKMFDSNEITNLNRIKQLQKLSIKLNGICMNLKVKNFDCKFAQKSCLLYDALIYKFGQSNKHQKFWQFTLQIYRDVKRINCRNLYNLFLKFSKVSHFFSGFFFKYIGSSKWKFSLCPFEISNKIFKRFIIRKDFTIGSPTNTLF